MSPKSVPISGNYYREKKNLLIQFNHPLLSIFKPPGFLFYTKNKV